MLNLKISHMTFLTHRQHQICKKTIYAIFTLIFIESYNVTIRQNRLDETILTNGHKIGIGREVRKLAFKKCPTEQNSCITATVCLPILDIQSTLDISNSDISNSRKLEASIWIKTTFLLLFSNCNLALGTFLQVQITRNAN